KTTACTVPQDPRPQREAAHRYLSLARTPEPRLKLEFLECLKLNSWESGPEEECSFLRACWEVSQLGWLTLVAMHAIEFSQNASRPVGECHLEPGRTDPF
ncbi:hypothetical protein LEMLEM_LOCUS9956, partial [Lemmus lemmus]